MFSDLDPLHSYDPLALLRALYDALFGSSDVATATTTTFLESASTFWTTFLYHFINIFARFAVFSVIICIVLAILIALYARKYYTLYEEIVDTVRTKEGTAQTESPEGMMENPKWKLVTEHVNSLDAAKWRLAIMEADIILSDLLDTLNLPGDTIGEKLKAVEASDFTTIEQAWEAHKIRNAIAHKGSEFLLTDREARRVIGLYEEVFKEFRVI